MFSLEQQSFNFTNTSTEGSHFPKWLNEECRFLIFSSDGYVWQNENIKFFKSTS